MSSCLRIVDLQFEDLDVRLILRSMFVGNEVCSLAERIGNCMPPAFTVCHGSKYAILAFNEGIVERARILLDREIVVEDEISNLSCRKVCGEEGSAGDCKDSETRQDVEQYLFCFDLLFFQFFAPESG